MGFWERYGDAMIAFGLVVATFVAVYWVLAGGLRRQSRKAEKQEYDTAAQVNELLSSQTAKGSGLQQIRHDNGTEPVDLTDGELKREVDGVLNKRGPNSQHSVLFPVDVVDRDQN